MAPITASWSKLLESERLKRSSQVLGVIKDNAYIFGGEVVSRQPVDDQIDSFNLQWTPQLRTTSNSSSPSPRVGSAGTSLNDRIYIFSGRGGVDMAPVDENGALWEFDPSKASWTKIEPASNIFPQARSFHTLTSYGSNTILLHAGCPVSGRLSDLWAFDLETKTWKELPSAPDPPRGGTSIAVAGNFLYRINGFDGKTEQGGSLDIFDLTNNNWSTKKYDPDGQAGPTPRSVSALLSVKIQGKQFLVTLFGERDPSSLGHAGAGKMLDDVWAYDVEAGTWNIVDAQSRSGKPEPRGWFAADTAGEAILVHGGLGESNERLNDVWLLTFA